MKKIEHHLFVCGSFRVGGDAKGACHKSGSADLLSYLQNEIQDRMLSGVEVAATGCLNMCNLGTVVIDYPSGHFYKKVDESVADEILDAIEAGTVAEQHLI